MDFGLTHEQEMIVSTVRNFVEKEIYPHAAEVERTGQVPRELGEAIKRIADESSVSSLFD